METRRAPDIRKRRPPETSSRRLNRNALGDYGSTVYRSFDDLAATFRALLWYERARLVQVNVADVEGKSVRITPIV